MYGPTEKEEKLPLCGGPLTNIFQGKVKYFSLLPFHVHLHYCYLPLIEKLFHFVGFMKIFLERNLIAFFNLKGSSKALLFDFIAQSDGSLSGNLSLCFC